MARQTGSHIIAQIKLATATVGGFLAERKLRLRVRSYG